MLIGNSCTDAVALPRIADSYALDQVGANVWRSRATDPRGGRMFGGTTMAQLLAAAHRSAPSELHTSNYSVQFLRPADGGAPCDYRVEVLRDGKSSAACSIDVIQRDNTLAVATVLLHRPRSDWGHESSSPTMEDPDSLPRTGMPHPARAIPADAFDIRYHDQWSAGTFERRLWFRALDSPAATIEDHECTVTLISDLYFFEPVVAQHGYRGDDRAIKYATTQHSTWFHRPPVADEWMVIQSRSPVAAGGRGLVTGEIRTQTGALVATLAQEVAVRLPATSPASSAHTVGETS